MDIIACAVYFAAACYFLSRAFSRGRSKGQEEAIVTLQPYVDAACEDLGKLRSQVKEMRCTKACFSCVNDAVSGGCDSLVLVEHLPTSRRSGYCLLKEKAIPTQSILGSLIVSIMKDGIEKAQKALREGVDRGTDDEHRNA